VRVAVIGAGVAGLAAGYRLAQGGHECDVYERWPGLGGQVATFDLGDGTLLERYYHHLFTTDAAIAALYDELGIEIEWLPSSMGVFSGGRGYAFTTPLDLLRFTAMSLRGRIRMGVATLMLQRRHTQVEPFESVTAHDWVRENMGHEAWDVLWGPLLHGKYGPRANEISMAWLWSKLTLRRRLEGKEARGEMLGYPRGGFQPLLDRLGAEIERRGGRVLIDRPAKSIAAADDGGFRVIHGAPDSFRRGHDPREFEQAGDPERYDAVVATVPSDIFAEMVEPSLANRLDPRCVAGTSAIPYQTALCVILELDRRFGRFYWTNIADDRLPFIGLIEQTNLIGPEHYGGRHLLYVANYVEPSDPLLGLDSEQLIDAYAPGLKLVNPSFDASWIRNRWIFREPAAQPVVTLGYRERMPPLETGVPGLILANTTQIYPEDRGTNYSVELGERAVVALEASLGWG
jgi:protoporphyrinogen oxidase